MLKLRNKNNWEFISILYYIIWWLITFNVKIIPFLTIFNYIFMRDLARVTMSKAPPPGPGVLIQYRYLYKGGFLQRSLKTVSTSTPLIYKVMYWSLWWLNNLFLSYSMYKSDQNTVIFPIWLPYPLLLVN